VKFAWIDQHCRVFEVSAMCSVLEVSRSGYYAWRDRRRQPLSAGRQRRADLVRQIRPAHGQSRGIYGSPRVHAELKARGTPVSLNTVAKYMRQEGIVSRIRRRFRIMTTDSKHQEPIAPNRLDRQFGAQQPDRTWCCDITYVGCEEGALYLAAVIDCYSRRIVGWAMADHLRAELCLDALDMALQRRCPAPGLLHHSDRGVQYASRAYREFLERHGLVASMSRTGNCYDNALMESFFGTLKTELVYHEHYATREQARRSIFEYIEVFYNRQRRHSAIGYMSPEAFETGRN
jgi:transposase InsO family protein